MTILPERARKQRLVCRQLSLDRLPDIEAVNQDRAGRIRAGRQCAGQKTFERTEGGSRGRRGERSGVLHEAWTERQARSEGSSRGIDPRPERLRQEAEDEPQQGAKPQSSRGRGRETQARPGGGGCRAEADDRIGKPAARYGKPETHEREQPRRDP